MGRVHDSRRAVDHAAEEIIVAAFANPYVDTATYRKRNAVTNFRVRQILLQLHRGTDGVARIFECGVDSVAGRLHDDASMFLHRCPANRVMTCQRRPHPLGLLLPQTGAALDVGEQERRNAGRRLHASAPSKMLAVAAEVYRPGPNISSGARVSRTASPVHH